MTQVFAIVITYNGSPWLRGCLESLQQSDHPVSIIVVDNASRDDSVAIAQSMDGVCVLRQSRNLGFGKANNVAITYAMKHGADFVFLLNQDAEVEPSTISELLSFMRDHHDAGVASPIHLNEQGSLLDKSFLANYLLPHAEEFIFYAYPGELATHYRVFSANAAAWLISRHCLQEVGGFDPIFFMYGEVDDYCTRMEYHGFSRYFVARARIRHAPGFHDPIYQGNKWKRLARSAQVCHAQAVRALKEAADGSIARSAYRVFTTLLLEGLSKSIASLSLSPLIPWALAALMVSRDLPRIARHKRACQTRGPTWLDVRIDPVTVNARPTELKELLPVNRGEPTVVL